MSFEDINVEESGSPEEQHERLDYDFPREQKHVQSEQVEDIPKLAVDDELLGEDVNSAESWLTWNKGLEETGFAPTEEITPENVDQLEEAWRIPETEPGKDKEGYFFKPKEPRSNPIIVPTNPPVLYFTEGDGTVHAVNARTGDEYWVHQPAFPDNPGGIFGWHRGAAVYENRVYVALPDVTVLALDRYTGEKLWRKEYFTDEQKNVLEKPNQVSVTQAPVVYDNKIFIGQSGDFGGYCVMSALDAKTGEPVWQKKTVPEEQWVENSWQYGSGAPWLTATVDPETETVFWSIANPTPWFFPAARPGPNKYTDSIIALDINSGELKWEHQILPADVWDYDAHNTPYLFDMEVDGETRRVVMADHKTGWSYVIDAESGRLLTRSEPWAKQDHMWADAFLSLPPLTKENKGEAWPGFSGATEWPPDSYSPVTGLHYLGGNNAANDIWRAKNWSYDAKKKGSLVGGGYQKLRHNGHSAHVAAVDPQSGDVVWKHELDDVNSKLPMVKMFTGGTTATGGNVVFHASSSGQLIALDATNGEKLWEAKTGQRILPSPVVWEDSEVGKVYVSVFANDYLQTYALDYGGQ
ncbi:pyrroloquinoline quinone-dependent dehydrogenase [Halorussus sp. AFM4]|uniref:pyrroloquinoline quinone-dependent dehydrogenase n=1 Tax=Halorussus sp. AFM4 TaxID=3421651 RepID=UPI003EBC4859